MLVSKCHKADMYVEDINGIPSYYVCRECLMACDPYASLSLGDYEKGNQDADVQ